MYTIFFPVTAVCIPDTFFRMEIENKQTKRLWTEICTKLMSLARRTLVIYFMSLFGCVKERAIQLATKTWHGGVLVLWQRKNKGERIQGSLSEMQNNLLAHVRQQREKHKDMCVCVCISPPVIHMHARKHKHTLLWVSWAHYSMAAVWSTQGCGLRAYSYRAGHTYATTAPFIPSGQDTHTWQRTAKKEAISFSLA